MTTDTDAELALYNENPFPEAKWQPMCRHRSSPAAAEATFEFGRFRLLLRRRQLVADGVPFELDLPAQHGRAAGIPALPQSITDHRRRSVGRAGRYAGTV